MKLVWINGCFDILHRGHFEMFKYAKSLGDLLVVGIDADNKVKNDKGPDRPYNCAEDRKFALECVRYINEVMIFHTRQELELMIEGLKPDIMIVGSDWKGKEVVGQKYAKELKFFERVGGYSTTNILDNIK
jgi:rfaE bifunctional protein nucleotidyltransferase chain/domain